MSRGGQNDGGSIEISFAGITDPTPVRKENDEEGEVSKGSGDGGVVRKAGKGHLPADDGEDDDSPRTAQEIIDDMNEDPADRRTADDVIRERDEAFKKAVSRAGSPFGGDEEVIKESDELEMPSAADWLSEAEKSDEEKLAERIGREVAKNVEVSEAERSPSEGVSLSTIMKDRPKVAKSIEEYIRQGGSFGDSLDEVKRWASA